jgi:hypothetical protein
VDKIERTDPQGGFGFDFQQGGALLEVCVPIGLKYQKCHSVCCITNKPWTDKGSLRKPSPERTAVIQVRDGGM